MQYAENKCLYGKYYVRAVCSRPYFKKPHVNQNLLTLETEMYIRKYDIYIYIYIYIHTHTHKHTHTVQPTFINYLITD
jgi:hypothetical protein